MPAIQPNSTRPTMSAIIAARAYANNVVAFIAWHVDTPIPGCLGFELTRLYADGTERPLAAWVPFEQQANPDWTPQDTGVWPIQKFSWRDLTVRQSRDGTTVRDGEILIRYRVRPVVAKKAGLAPVPARLKKTYTGDAVPLSYYDEGIVTEQVRVSQHYGEEFQATFTNGILSSQGLAKRLSTIAKKKLTAREQSTLVSQLIRKKGDPLRAWLAGDVLPAMLSMFEKARTMKGRLRLALYELNDPDLISQLVANASRVEVILCTAGSSKTGGWDTTNHESRQKLIDAGVTVHHRLFNNSARIGHNKFVVLLDPKGKPIAVLTGSTNWTATGLCGQSNNATIIAHAGLAAQFNAEWEALRDDTAKLAVQGTAETFAKPNNNVQGPALRSLNGEGLAPVDLTRGTADVWFSPNTKRTSKGTDTPPDLQALYRLMRQAKDAILFAVFQPSVHGDTSIIAEAVSIGQKDRSLLVFGAVSDPSAMPVSPLTRDRDGDGKISAAEQANTYIDQNVQVVLATALGQDDLAANFEYEELLTTGKAIIHDKIVVIDPLSETNCTVAFGSHNLGYKASYCNDENLVIVRGRRDLVLAYAVHVIDVWEHYRFRAIQVENHEQGKRTFDGFLRRDGSWQKPSLTATRAMLSKYFAGVPG
jgi:phosphatidylserine/phosphatidylglycerophosphate/cardiolipin synthase-like enzyme